MAKKRSPDEGNKKVNNPNVMGLRAQVQEQQIGRASCRERV